MNIELTEIEFRRLLDMVYIGNWVLNSARGNDRFADYDVVESKIFSKCAECGMDALMTRFAGNVMPSRAFEDGGIHEAISDYEDAVFFDILAEELSVRDMGAEPRTEEQFADMNRRIEEYLDEFDENGLENLTLEK